MKMTMRCESVTATDRKSVSSLKESVVGDDVSRFELHLSAKTPALVPGKRYVVHIMEEGAYAEYSPFVHSGRYNLFGA